MPRPNSLNHWKITQWTALARGGFRSPVRFRLLSIFSLLFYHRGYTDPPGVKVPLNCDLLFNSKTQLALAIISWTDSKSYMIQFSWPSIDKLYSENHVGGDWDPFCWMALMIVHVGLGVPIPPIIISTGQPLTFFAIVMYTTVIVWQSSISDKTVCSAILYKFLQIIQNDNWVYLTKHCKVCSAIH